MSSAPNGRVHWDNHRPRLSDAVAVTGYAEADRHAAWRRLGSAELRHQLNYGTNKMRFITPVRSGARMRARITLADVEDKGGGRVLMTTRHVVEIEGEDKPALVADTLALLLGRP
jgi:acyl dehydratase